MSDRPDQPKDKVNDGDGNRLSSSVQNQVFDDMVAQSAASGKWNGKNGGNPSSDAGSAEHSASASATTAQKQQEQPGDAPKTAPTGDNLSALTQTKAQQDEITRPPTNSLLTAASREIDDLAFGRGKGVDNTAMASENAKALGMGVKDSQLDARMGAGIDRENPNILNIPIPIEFIRDQIRALQDRSQLTNTPENQAFSTEVQRRKQADANIQEKEQGKQQEKQQETEAKNLTDKQNQRPEDVAQKGELQTANQSADAAVRNAIANNEARAESTLVQKQDVVQATDQAAGRINDQSAVKGTEATRLPVEVNAPTDLNAAGRATADGAPPKAESDQTRGAVRDAGHAADALVAAMDARMSGQMASDGQTLTPSDVANEVPATKISDKGDKSDKSDKSEENSITKLGRAIADFARQVLSTLFGDGKGDSKKEESMEKEEGDSSETETETESEDERQKKIQEEQRPTYIVMEGDYLELVSTKLYSNTMFTSLLKQLNPNLSITRQYMGVLGVEVDMLKAGERIELPMPAEIEEFLRSV